MRQTPILFLLFILFLVSCEEQDAKREEIEAIAMKVQLNRFDKAFDAASVEDLPELKRTYPFFFPTSYPDSIWAGRLNDSLQQQLHDEVMLAFPNEETLEEELRSLFQHVTYYFPQFDAPSVYTTTSDVDYRNKVILADSLLVVSLDCYLGEDHPFYTGIPAYVIKNLKKEQIPSDVAAAIARRTVAPPQDRTLLAQMVYFGKELYLKDLWLPDATDAQKIGYSDLEMEWAEANEVDIWRYFIENESLYSTDAKLVPRFISPAPFSKFYLEIDNESPGSIGRFIGWQIVRAYMKNNDTSLSDLMNMKAEDIFNSSKYKPNK